MPDNTHDKAAQELQEMFRSLTSTAMFQLEQPSKPVYPTPVENTEVKQDRVNRKSDLYMSLFMMLLPIITETKIMEYGAQAVVDEVDLLVTKSIEVLTSK
jgi:hypothetical protein